MISFLSYVISTTILLVVRSANGNCSALTSKTSFKVNLLMTILTSLCDRNCVILWTNRTRCTLYKKILDLLDEVIVSGAHSGRASL